MLLLLAAIKDLGCWIAHGHRDGDLCDVHSMIPAATRVSHRRSASLPTKLRLRVHELFGQLLRLIYLFIKDLYLLDDVHVLLLNGFVHISFPPETNLLENTLRWRALR